MMPVLFAPFRSFRFACPFRFFSLFRYVIKAYQRSLLYAVSNALERKQGKPILGMQKFSKVLERARGLNINYSNGRGTVTRSQSHGGFDNDTHAVNSLLMRVLNGRPKKPFNDQEMKGY